MSNIHNIVSIDSICHTNSMRNINRKQLYKVIHMKNRMNKKVHSFKTRQMLFLQHYFKHAVRNYVSITFISFYNYFFYYSFTYDMCITVYSQSIFISQIDYVHCLVPDLRSITACSFYWGKMDRYEAERLLEGKQEGTFLLRDSAQEEFLFSVSFRKYGRSLHARIEQWNHKFSFDSHDPGVYASETVRMPRLILINKINKQMQKNYNSCTRFTGMRFNRAL